MVKIVDRLKILRDMIRSCQQDAYQRTQTNLPVTIVEVTTGETEKIEPPIKNPHAQALSKLGASKGARFALKSSHHARSQLSPRRPLKPDGVSVANKNLLIP
jgi:hypothetical protein